ncbi:sugar ABC transporter substrate-binding protein [Orenia marismortui]|uniref:Extracellular solute-binding protein n=1 Tax=Orenia marismortui TaxID=46469 RepID=A0A4R8GT80_9FIRM|nr:extracellular solute-binding protein [Orenia marismortui]TDX49212.1 extracellular solute-binding protein [Orenia marismortui]
MKLKILILGLALILVLGYIYMPRKEVNMAVQMTEEEAKGLQKILKEYERFHFVEFNLLNIPFSNHFTRIQEFLESGKKIDIARIDIKTPEWFKKYIVADTVIPQSVDCLLLFYNPNIIKMPPPTLDDFINYTREYTIDESGRSLGEEDFSSDKIVQYGSYISLYSGWWMSVFFGSEDENFLTEDVDYNSFINVAKRFKRLYKENSLPKVDNNNFYDQMVKMFIEEKVAMMINGPWVLSSLDKSNQDFKIALLPKGGEGSFSPMGGQQWAMLNDKPVIRDVMKYLSSEEVARKFYKYNGTIMPNDEFLEELIGQGDIVAKQLLNAVKINKSNDYLLYNFFSLEFRNYLEGNLNEDQLFKLWKNKVKTLN